MKEFKNKLDQIKEVEDKQAQKQKELDEKLKICFASALKTKEGQIAFKLIKKLSLWDEASVNTSAEGELYKRGRRDMWLMIRQYIPKKILAQIEIFDEFKLEEL